MHGTCPYMNDFLDSKVGHYQLEVNLNTQTNRRQCFTSISWMEKIQEK